ncbi:NAD(P)-dependent oxidoreductase [Herbaspirillum sp. HC18]|nr:NAD(P)-dependent oxidoreductase [Herbaspirillum sp. HC18]
MRENSLEVFISVSGRNGSFLVSDACHCSIRTLRCGFLPDISCLTGWENIMQAGVTIGLIGIGAMGMAMAKNLHRKGYAVSVRDIRPDADDEARACGMRVCASPAAIAEEADLVIIVVVNATQIEQVLFGADGLVKGASQGKTVMLCSTIAPRDTTRFAQRLAQHGVDTIDAPISGGPARAEAGTMSMMLAAREDLLQRHEDVLSALSDKRFRISETTGDGAKAKLVNNLLAGINLVAGAEALALGMKIGLDADKLFEVINASSGASWIFQDRMARALKDDFTPRAFAHILTKDVTLATDMADGAGHDTPLGNAALAIFRQTVENGWADLDDAAVIKTYLKTTS